MSAPQSRYSNTHLVGLLENQFPSWCVQEGENEYTVPEFLAFWRQYQGDSFGPEVWYRWTPDSSGIEVFDSPQAMAQGKPLLLLTPSSIK